MVSVDLNRLKGNFAESIVSAWLSRACLVRTVAEGTDIGVDLYCESVLSGEPFLHFWAQVKTINASHLKVVNGEEQATFPFERRHLEYWDRQPIPVYAFLVPVLTWPPAWPNRVYGIRITDKLQGGVPDRQYTTYSTTDFFSADDLDTDLRQFITKVVPHDAAAMLMKRGAVVSIPPTDDDKEGRFPLDVNPALLPRILSGIRDASVQGLLQSLLHGEPLRTRFEEVARLFEEDMTNMGLSVLVKSACEDGRFNDAAALVARAIERIAASDLMPAEKLSEIEKLRTLMDVIEHT